MKAIIEARIVMLYAIEELYEANKARLDVVPAFAPNMALVKDNIKNIKNWLPMAKQSARPTTGGKDYLIVDLSLAVVEVCIPIQGYAASIGDVELEGQMNWTADKLQRLRKDLVGSTCRSIHAKGEALKAQVAPFNLTQDVLNKLGQLSATWEEKESATRAKQVAISEAVRQVTNLTSTSMRLLEKLLDRMVLTLGSSDPEIVGLWEQTRRVITPPHTETTLHVTVVANTEARPCGGAEVTVALGSTIVLHGITNEEGHLEFKPLKRGKYNIAATAPVFQSVSVNEYRVIQGKINKVTLILPTLEQE